MLKAIVIIAVVLLIAVVAILVYASTRPDTFRTVRSITINAPPDKIFPLINDFQQWTAWSPYEKKDPAMRRVFSGASTGKGAIYEWDGNNQVGKGRIEIMDASQPSAVTIKLDMIKPMEGHNLVNFTLEPLGSTTRVTWAMQGSSPYIAKLMGVFMDMDKMIGGDFESGLAKLKEVAER